MGQDQVSGEVSVLCWLAAPIAMFYGNLQNLVIRSKLVIKSSLVILSSQIGLMSDQLRVSLYIVMSQNVPVEEVSLRVALFHIVKIQSIFKRLHVNVTSFPFRPCFCPFVISHRYAEPFSKTCYNCYVIQIVWLFKKFVLVKILQRNTSIKNQVIFSRVNVTFTII